MKRYIVLAGLLLSLCTPLARAQETPAAVAERQEAEERYKRMTAKVEDLEAAVQSFQQRFAAMAEEIRSLREELARAKNPGRDAALEETLKAHAKAIEEVDRKRQADNEKVIAEFERLGKRLLERPAPQPPRTKDPGTSTSPGTTASTGARNSSSEKGYEYTIRAGDTLSGLVLALGKQNPPIKVTQKQLREANPKVNWDRLSIGQKVFIPAPAQP